MYDFVDRPVEQLDGADRATLMAIRRWVHALTAAGTLPATGPMAAGEPFGAAMRLIDEGSVDDLPIGRPCQPLVGESEAVLIALWQLVDDGRAAAATALAGMIAGPERAAALVAAIDATHR